MINRIIEKKLKNLAKQYRVVTVIGPRQAGKSTLCKKAFPSKPYVNLEDPEQRALALNDPKALLNRYPNGCFIDEIQRAPELLSYIQVRVDADNAKAGMYILSGSHQILLMESISQSLAGRTAIVKLLPLSQIELKNYNTNLSIDEIIFKGSYPEIINKNLNPSEAYSFYVQTYLERDVRQIQAVRDLSLFQNFIKLLAGRSGQLLNMTALSNDLGVSENTIKNWLSVAEASFLAFKLKPYYKNLGKRITKTPKFYFYDTGLLCYLLGIKSSEQLRVHPLRGSIFETYIVSECLKYLWNNIEESNLYFYLDKVLEIDLLADTASGPVLIEIKSAETFRKELVKKLFTARKRLKGIREDMYLITGGKDCFSYNEVEVISSQEISVLWEKIEV